MSRADTVSVGILIDRATRDRARAAIAALRGTDHAIDGGMSGLIETLLAREVKRLERAHNGGQPFPDVDRLPAGPGI